MLANLMVQLLVSTPIALTLPEVAREMGIPIEQVLEVVTSDPRLSTQEWEGIHFVYADAPCECGCCYECSAESGALYDRERQEQDF